MWLSKNHGYEKPYGVRRKDVPKPNGSTRPLGIPCIWDRLIQQCLKQVLEPICEEHFSKHSYGFRPNYSVEHAIADVHIRLQHSHLHYVIEFDIKGFFDNVNHTKLIRQMWTLGIRDKHLLGKILCILKAPVKESNGKLEYPKKGTPQGGIISPLLANIVLNELDHWIESNWEENPIVHKYAITTDAERTKIAITQWLTERLKLEVLQEKTRVVNVKKKYAEFLGFKIKVHSKGGKQVVKSHIRDKQLKTKRKALVEQVKRIARPQPNKSTTEEIWQYNKMVVEIQNYYRIATDISLDASKLNRAVMIVITNRLDSISRKGRKLTPAERTRYGKSAKLRFIANEPIYPIGYMQHKIPMNKSRKEQEQIVDDIKLNLMRQPLYGRSVKCADNRISLYSAQRGKCAVTGEKFTSMDEIHCHHKLQKFKGGTDDYQNLVLVTETAHKLIHATNAEIIQKYLQTCKPDMKKLNALIKLVGNTILSVD